MKTEGKTEMIDRKYDSNRPGYGREEAKATVRELEAKAKAKGWNPGRDHDPRFHLSDYLEKQEIVAYNAADAILRNTVDLNPTVPAHEFREQLRLLTECGAAVSIRSVDGSHPVSDRIQRLVNSLVLRELTESEKKLTRPARKYRVHILNVEGRTVEVEAESEEDAALKVEMDENSEEIEGIEEVKQ